MLNRKITLLEAAGEGNESTVNQLLAEKKPVDQQDKQGNTALMEASRCGHAMIVRKLLTHNATIDKRNLNGFTALMLAAREGQFDVVHELLFNKANRGFKNSNGLTAFLLAVNNNYLEVVRLFLSIGIEELDQVNNKGYTALMLAATHNYVEMFKELLIFGANLLYVSIQTGENVNSLIFGKGHEKLVEEIYNHSEEEKNYPALKREANLYFDGRKDNVSRSSPAIITKFFLPQPCVELITQYASPTMKDMRKS